MRKRLAICFLGLCLLVLALYFSDRLLSFDDTRKCDAALVLAGEEQHRVDRGIELIQRGYANHLFVDVPKGSGYGRPFEQQASEYLLTRLRPDQFTVCVIVGDSTLIEAREARPCLRTVPDIHSILLATHDSHSRRALMSFRQVLPEYEFHVSAVHERYIYQPHWWHTRENFKNWVMAMTKMLWYLLVERWLVMLHWM